MISLLSVLVVGAAGIYVLFWALLHLSQDKREPETVDDAVPFLGPILSMASKGSKYHPYLRLGMPSTYYCVCVSRASLC